MAKQMSIYDAIKKNYEDAARRAQETARRTVDRISDFDLDDITQTARRADTTDPDLRTRGARAAQSPGPDRRGAFDVADRARRPSPEGMNVEARSRQARNLPIGTQGSFVDELPEAIPTDPDMTVEVTGRTQPAARFTDTTDMARTQPGVSGMSGVDAPNVRRDLEATARNVNRPMPRRDLETTNRVVNRPMPRTDVDQPMQRRDLAVTQEITGTGQQYNPTQFDRTARDVNRPMPRQQPGSDLPVGTGPRGREVEFTNLDDVTKTDVTVRDPGVSSRARQAAYRADLDGTFSKLAKELPKFDSAAKAKNFVKGMGAVGAVASLALIGDTIRRIKAGEEDPGVLMDILDPLFVAPKTTVTGEQEEAELAEFLRQNAAQARRQEAIDILASDVEPPAPSETAVGPTTTGQRRSAFPMAPRNNLLAVGARGSQVRALNEDLQALGFLDTLPGDPSEYTNRTRRAVMDLQRAAGFTGRDVDGIVGSMTRAAIAEAPEPPKARRAAPKPAPARELTAQEEAIQEGELTKARTRKAIDVFEEELEEGLGGEPMEDLDLKIGKIQMRQAGR